MKTRSGQVGISLIELIITIVVISILAVVAMPSFLASIDRQRVRGATEGLFGDMQYAKSEAIKRGANISVITTGGGPWSYCVTRTDCATAADVLKTVTGTDYKNVSLGASVTVTFDALRGGCSGAGCDTAITFTGSSGATSSVTVSGMGRVRLQ